MGFVCVNLCLGFQTLSETGTTSFLGHTIIVLLLYIFGLLAFYSKYVTIFPTGLTGHNLTCRFNPVSVVISAFTCGLLRLIRLVSLASLL